MYPRLTRWGLATAASLAWLLPATAARAQYSYGYDSLSYAPTAQTYWYNSGYQSVYTDPSTGAFANGEAVPNRTLVPYANPPYGEFRRNNDLPAVAPRPTLTLVRPAAVSAATDQAPQRVIRPRRGLLRRRR